MTLPEWLEPLYSPDEMRAADRFAIERRGIFEIELAEKAGAGLAAAVRAVAKDGPIRIVAGPGNNGGDGIIAARLLRDAGYEVDVLAPLSLEGLEGVPRTNLDRLPGEPPKPFEAALLEGSGAVVDALLGTGFTGAVGEPLDVVIAEINVQEAPVVAADVPSGVNAATGEVEGVAVEATATSTNHAPKIGLFVGPGARHAGLVKVTDIGTPPGEPGAGLAGLTSRRVLGEIPARSRRDSEPEPGSGLGNVLVAGGTRDSAGAPCLAALAAMRGGAGWVSVVVPVSAAPAVGSRLPEAVVHGLPEDRDGRHLESGAQALARLASRQLSTPQTIVLGPGLKDSPDEVSFAPAVSSAASGAGAAPLVISSTSLLAHAPGEGEALDELAGRPGHTLLVASLTEAAHLLGEDAARAGQRPLATARALADRSGSVAVLRSEPPVVASTGGPCAVNSIGPKGTGAALDTNGSGDMLAGLIGALLSKGSEPFEAAAAGVFAHAEAGKLASERLGGAEHTIASDLIEALPEALSTPG